MLPVAYAFAGLAALVHVYIFWIESIVFTTSGRKAFGINAEDAATMTSIFYNQGFYNLFLAIGTTAGIGMSGSNRDASLALVVFGTGSMLTAALVLVTADASKARGAVVQGLFPLISLVALGIWALS